MTDDKTSTAARADGAAPSAPSAAFQWCAADGPLALALQRDAAGWAGTPLEPLTDAGLAHAHVRLVGTGLLARIPKQSQLGLEPVAALAYEAACFTHTAPSGHVPRLQAVLQPSAWLPRGALLVEEIVGRSAALPDDLPAVMQALAALHWLALPPVAQRAPLRNATDPLADLRQEIAAHACFLDGAALAPAVRRAIDAEIGWFDTLCAAPARPPRCLVSFDAHPGNFIIRPDGRAMLVDLEKCRYGPASLDLAHASLYTSTTWDVSGSYALSVAQVAASWGQWAQARGLGGGADQPWHLPLRRAMWLWSITWCAMWRVQSRTARHLADDAAADWSQDLSEAALVRHVRGRVDHYLDADTVAMVLAEFDALERLAL